MSGHDERVGRPPLIPSAAAPAQEAANPPRPAARGTTQEFGTVVVVGGGCYGAFYLRQLGRAALAGVVTWDRLVLVDRDPGCRVARERDASGGWPPGAGVAELVASDWGAFFAGYLDAAALEPAAASRDAIVPSPLMPHLMFDWLLDRARRRWPARRMERRPLRSAPAVPWTRQGNDGTQYVSFAEWMCPINCIEPARCPHTRGPRDWSMPPAVQAFVAAERATGRALLGPCIFHCSHRAYGVGMIDTSDVLRADELVATAGTAGAAEVLVGTVSHCHGALGVLAVGGE